MRPLISSLCMLAISVCGIAQTKTTKNEKTAKSNSMATTPFTPPCPLPFTATSGLSIDKTCGMLGGAAAKTPEGLQNQAKNNFCALGPAATVTPAILLSLQHAAEAARVSFGSHAMLPKDRSTLRTGFPVGGKTYREGQRVQLAAFLIETHPADLSSGESVNCDIKGDPLG